ncbi:MAG: hypothetical protein V3U45_04860 [bacterium]
MADDRTRFACGCEIWTQETLGERAFMYRACPRGRACEVYAIVKEESEKIGHPFIEVEVPP